MQGERFAFLLAGSRGEGRRGRKENGLSLFTYSISWAEHNEKCRLRGYVKWLGSKEKRETKKTFSNSLKKVTEKIYLYVLYQIFRGNGNEINDITARNL